MSRNDEHDLVRKCLKGDSSAQRSLYEQYKVPMFRLCLRYARDWPEAEDILQDGFVKVFNDLKNYRFEGALGGWIRRVILNAALMHVRRQKRLFPVESLENAAELDTGGDVLADLNARALTKLLQQLPAGYRAVFNLYAVEGYSHKEIAEMLGIDEGTSKSQLFKARKTLKTMIESIMASEKQALENQKTKVA